jgi:hypothetical protein
MRTTIWLWLSGWIAMIGLLVACSPLSPKAPLELPPPYRPALEATAVLGVEAAAPLPEYRLNLTLDPATYQLVGQQQVTFPNRTGVALDEIVFRLYPNLPQYGGQIGIGPVWVDGKRRTPSLRAADTSLAIPLPQPLPAGGSATIALTFSVKIPQKEAGYALFGYSQGVWSLPDAYPLLAVHDGSMGLAGPGSSWHEDIAPAHGDAVFAEAALYDVTLTLPPTLTLATTGTIVSDTLNADGQRVYHVAGGPLREFAWLASAAYRLTETTAYGTTLRSYYLSGDEVSGQTVLNIAVAALGTYEDAFGPYPCPEMAVVEAPLLHFGMEYPGLNLIGLDLYRNQGTELENRVAHEIAHQWWYAQVGNDQINTPWLDEGLAEYSMAIYDQQVFGEAQRDTLVNQRWLVPYQVAVQNGYDAVVNQPSAAFSWEYEVIVYGKAALFFDALHQELGDETFKAVLRAYATRYRWRIATPDDFLDVAESVSGRDLHSLYNYWILSKR